MVLIVVLIKNNYFSPAPSFIHQLEVLFHHFDLERCDEKTFYITVLLKYRMHKVPCDFIYIMDQEVIYGAISINKHYEQARKFIQQHFRHALLYSDELIVAKKFMQTFHFKQSVQAFAKKYPKFILNTPESKNSKLEYLL